MSQSCTAGQRGWQYMPRLPHEMSTRWLCDCVSSLLHITLALMLVLSPTKKARCVKHSASKDTPHEDALCREKVCATKWYHVARYAMPYEKAEKVDHVRFKPPAPPAPPGCKDSEFSCLGWAESGECESNAGFMIGNKGRPGHCLLSCGRCDLMENEGSP